MVIGNLIVNLKAGVAKYIANMDRARAAKNRMGRSAELLRKTLKRLALAAVAAAGIGGLGLVGKSAIDAGDLVQKLAIQFQESTEFLSEMRFATQIAGVEFKTFARSMQIVQVRVRDAKRGLATYTEVFDELKLRAEDLAQLGVEEQFLVLAEALRQVKDASRQTALAYQVFGGRGVELLRIVNLGSEALLEMRDKARQVGVSLNRMQADAMADANDQMTILRASTEGLANELVVHLGPAIAATTNFMQIAVKPAVQFVSDAFEVLTQALRKYWQGMLIVIANTATWADSIPGLGSHIASLREKVQSMADLLGAQFNDAVLDADTNTRAFTFTAGAALEPLVEMTNQASAAADAVDALAKAQARAAAIVARNVTPLERYQDQLRELVALRPHLTQAQYNRAIGNYTEQLRGATTETAALSAEVTTLSEDRFADLRNSIEGVGRTLEDSFINAARNGKLAIRDMVESMLEDIARLLFRRNVAEPLVSGIAGSISGSGILSSLFGGAPTSAPTVPPPGAISGHLAGGGAAIAGRSYVVGERGREVFTPGASGHVTPNDQLGGGGGVVNINFTVNAIDSQSFAGALAQHQGTLIGIVRQATHKAMRR